MQAELAVRSSSIIFLVGLREVDVPVGAILDFDVITAKRPLRDIAEAAGLAWDQIEADWREVKVRFWRDHRRSLFQQIIQEVFDAGCLVLNRPVEMLNRVDLRERP